MCSSGVVPRLTRSAPDRKRLFSRGGGVQKGNFLADFLAFPLPYTPPMAVAP